MVRFIFKRLCFMVLTLWIIVTITFFLMNILPGNPVRTEFFKSPPDVKVRIMHQYGYDKPLHVQYALYLNNLLHGDLGQSTQAPYLKAASVLTQRAPVSAIIGLQAICVGLILGLTLGIIAAFHRRTWVDYTILLVTIICISIPQFVLIALMQLTVGGTVLPLFGWPAEGAPFMEKIRYSILPVTALSLGSVAVYARYMRSSVLDIINQDYILLAKSKGLSRVQIAWKYIVRNAMIPFVTMIPPQIAGVFTGAFIVESMFSIPGVGEFFVSCMPVRDYTMIMATTIFAATLYIVSLFFVDILYAVVDPRITITS